MTKLINEMITNIGSKVKLLELDNTKGRITGVYIDSNKNPKYNVRYFFNGDSKDCYFFSDEVEII